MGNKRDSILQRPAGFVDVRDLGAPKVTYAVLKFPDADLFFVALYKNGVQWVAFPPNEPMLVSPSRVHLMMEMANAQLYGLPVEEHVFPPDADATGGA